MGLIARARDWLAKKFVPGPAGTIYRFGDVYGSQKAPNDQDLLTAYRDTAFFCANLNINAVINQKLRLYVKTSTGQTKPKCLRRPITPRRHKYLAGLETIGKAMETADDVEEVTEHPLLELLKYPNDYHAQTDMIGAIQLYLELTGKAYVYVESGGLFSIPQALWVLPTQAVTPQQTLASDKIIDFYWYWSTRGKVQIPPEEMMVFRNFDPRDPYSGGYAPANAAWERISVVSKYLSQTQATLDNRARPDSIVSSSDPEYTIPKPEADRLTALLNSQFRGRGSHGIYVSSHGLKIDPLAWSPKDMGELAETDATIHQIARVFDVPLALLNQDANRANAAESRNQHAEMAVRPRLRRLETVLNRFLVSRYSDRLFLCFDDPVNEDQQQAATERSANLASGYTTINELRAEDGLEAVDWGDEPWLPGTLRQPSEERPEVTKIDALANKPPAVGAKAIEAAIKGFAPTQLAEFETHRKRLAADLPVNIGTRDKAPTPVSVSVSLPPAPQPEPAPPEPEPTTTRKRYRHWRDDAGQFHSEVITESNLPNRKRQTAKAHVGDDGEKWVEIVEEPEA